MSGRFYQNEQEFFFESGDGLDMQLDQDNYWVWLSRSEPLKDMAQVTDPRDEMSWTWFRYDIGNEQFNQLDMIARQVGSVILREVATEDVNLAFDARHAITDDDLEALLEGDDEPRE